MNLCIYEDAYSADMHPLTYTRPVFDLRCGVLHLHEKIKISVLHEKCTYATRTFLQDYLQDNNFQMQINSLDPEDTLFVNSRVLPDALFQDSLPKDAQASEQFFVQNQQILAAFIPAQRMETVAECIEDGIIRWENFPSDVKRVAVEWATVRYPWDLINLNAEEIAADIQRLELQPNFNPDHFPYTFAKNKSEVYLGQRVQLKPGVVLDAESGPIFLDDDVIVKPNAVITGPCYIGKKSEISAGSNITGKCSFGPVCKVGGEVGQTIIQGYTNKKHDGFLGGAYLGEWVNIGAGTNNSDLKNNYSTVKVQINGTPIDTQSQFVGCMIGDHTKIGIGSTINTGTVIGTGCNIFGSGFPRKYVPAFSWGNGSHLDEHRLDKMLETARTAMERRNVPLTNSYESMLRNVFQQTATDRVDTRSKV